MENQTTVTVRIRNERERAREAMRLVRQIEGKAGSDTYLSQVRGAAIIIQTNGLAQAVAFWNSKKENPYRWLVEHIGYFITGEKQPPSKLQQTILEMDAFKYRDKSREALAGLVWLSRFATAVLSKEEPPKTEGKNEPGK